MLEMHVDVTKSERKQLRELASSAYEAEAQDVLTVLDADYAR